MQFVSDFLVVYDPLIGDWNLADDGFTSRLYYCLWPAYRGLKLGSPAVVLVCPGSLWPAYRGLKPCSKVKTRRTDIPVYDPLIGDWNPGSGPPEIQGPYVYDPLIGDWNAKSISELSWAEFSLWPAYRGLKHFWLTQEFRILKFMTRL